MIQIFNKQVNQFIEQLGTFSKNKEFRAISFHSHTIKSSARNIGNKRLYKICDKIENVSSLEIVPKKELNALLIQFREEAALTQRLLKESRSSVS